jgi:hypothetical protein
MAKENMPPTAASDIAPKPQIVRPTGLTNLAAKFPMYDGGDARILKKGTVCPPIHGMALGIVDLPSIQKNEDGTPKEWRGMVIELLQPAPCSDAGAEADEIPTYRPKGTRIILNMTAAVERFEKVAKDPRFIYEVFIEPIASKTKDGARSLWVFDTFEVGRPEPRLAKHNVMFEIASDVPGAAPARLAAAPAHAPNGS